MLNEQTVVYFAGNNLVLHNLDTKEQRFLSYTDTERGEAKCVTVASTVTLMAFALELDASTIHMVDLQAWQRRPSISLPSGFSPTSFTCLAFSGNGKFLIGQGGTGESMLHYFDVKNGNHLGGTKVTTNPSTTSSVNAIVTGISINPNEPASICCTGRGIFRLINKSDKGFIIKQSSMANKDTFDFRSHIWTLDGRTIITALADGRISQLDLSLVRVDINLNNPTGNPVTHLTATQKGFLCVTGGTRLHFFERTGEKGWQESNTVQIDEKETISSVAIAQADDRVTVLLSDSRLVSVPFSQSDHGQNAEPMVTLLPPHHIGPVTAIDVTFRKQLLVSCGEDHAIRVWNYEKCSVKFLNSLLINHSLLHSILMVVVLLLVLLKN
jgi:WD40 repeat protein